jgi:hypothetical protein
MKYAILGPRNNIIRLVDQIPQEEYIEISEEQAEKVISFKEQNRLSFLIDDEITNFKDQYSIGNSMRWDNDYNKWVISPIIKN